MACEEMQLFYAYLDQVAEAKRRAQPWECEVTIFPEDGEPAVVTAPAAGGFSCDDVTDASEKSPPSKS